MATGDKQQPISAKKSALREIPNENRNTIHKSPGNSPFPMDKTPVKDTVKPSCIASPNGPLVYVRRKLETDSGKINNNNFDSRKHERESAKINGGSSDSPPLKKSRNDNSINELAVPTLNCSSAPVAVPLQAESKSSAVSFPFRPEPQKPRHQHWKERFDQLQMFLKACDQSNHEDYIHKLISLSAAERSRHAYELEKRAIHLTLEEGKELHRVRVLNVLNKASPDRHASVPAQLQSSVAREERSVREGR